MREPMLITKTCIICSTQFTAGKYAVYCLKCRKQGQAVYINRQRADITPDAWGIYKRG